MTLMMRGRRRVGGLCLRLTRKIIMRGVDRLRAGIYWRYGARERRLLGRRRDVLECEMLCGRLRVGEGSAVRLLAAQVGVELWRLLVLVLLLLLIGVLGLFRRGVWRSLP